MQQIICILLTSDKDITKGIDPDKYLPTNITKLNKINLNVSFIFAVHLQLQHYQTRKLHLLEYVSFCVLFLHIA